MDSRLIRRQALIDALATRIVVLDGAMGTMLHQYNPTIEDWGGPKFENCPENLLFTRPNWILDIHRAYYKAGADVVETDSFGGSVVTLAEFDVSGHEVIESMMPLNAAERDDPGRVREEEARALARVVVRKLADQVGWTTKQQPDFYGLRKEVEPETAPKKEGETKPPGTRP